MIINGKQAVKLKSGSINFKNYFKQLAVPFKIYTDFEYLLSAIPLKEVQSSGYSFAYKVFCIDNRFSKKYVLYRRRNESHLIIKEISKFDIKVSVIPNGLEK